MDNVAEFDPDSFAQTAFRSEADRVQDAAEARIALMQRRMKRKIRNQKRRAQAMGMLDGIVSQLQPGDIAVDCGAGVGAVTRRLAATGATVYAFEPDPKAFAQLEKRCGDLPNVHLVRAAVGAEAGTTTLDRSPLLDGMSGAGDATSDDAAAEVPVHDLVAILDDLIAGREPAELPAPVAMFRRPNAVAFLKLGIDGAELPVMTALHEAGALAAIRTTVVETHERKHPELREDYARMRAAMTEAYKSSKVYLDWV